MDIQTPPIYTDAGSRIATCARETALYDREGQLRTLTRAFPTHTGATGKTIRTQGCLSVRGGK